MLTVLILLLLVCFIYLLLNHFYLNLAESEQVGEKILTPC